MKPTFPPLLSGHELKAGQNPARKAASGAKKGKYGAGDLLWLNDASTLDYAIVLEPTIDRKSALQMVFLQMVAIGDAIGAIAPPEVGVTYHWPNELLANGAKFGSVRAILSETDGDDQCPHFLVLSTTMAIKPEHSDLNPGLQKDQTTLWDEGCGELTTQEVLESAARHFTTWVNTWEEEGFKSVLALLDQRMVTGHDLTQNGETGTYLGMDENADLLMKTENGTKLVCVTDALDTDIKAFV